MIRKLGVLNKISTFGPNFGHCPGQDKSRTTFLVKIYSQKTAVQIKKPGARWRDIDKTKNMLFHVIAEITLIFAKIQEMWIYFRKKKW